MMKSPKTLWTIAIALLLVPALVVAAPKNRDHRVRRLVQKASQPLIASGKYPGIAIGVIVAGRRQMFFYGEKRRGSKQPLGPHTVFETGSLTKVFTSVLLARLIGDRVVALNDNIAKYLPIPLSGSLSRVTLRHLATHMSGLPRVPAGLKLTSGNPYHGYGVVQLHADLKKVKLRSPPGQKYNYSNWGAGLLAHILTLATKQSYESLLRRYLFGPSGMRTSGLRIAALKTRDVASGYLFLRDLAVVKATYWELDAKDVLAGCGGVASTLSDMLSFLGVNMARRNAKLWTALRLSHRPMVERKAGRRWIGLAWQISTVSGSQIIWHNGGTLGFKAFMGFVPGSKIGVVVYTNRHDASPQIDLLAFKLLKQLAQIR